MPEEVLPDPTEPSRFWLKSAGMFSSNYKVMVRGFDEGLLWKLRKTGKFWKDDCVYSILNYQIPEGEKQGRTLAVCKFDTLDRKAFKQYDIHSHEDSDDSDDYSSDSDSDEETAAFGAFGATTETPLLHHRHHHHHHHHSEFKQKSKWVLKTKSKFYWDEARTQKVFKLTTKGKGKSKRKITFREERSPEGEVKVHKSIEKKTKVKKLFYKIEPVAPDGTESKTEEIPIGIHGSLKGRSDKLEWTCPFFDAEVEGRSGNKAIVSTKPGILPAMSCLIGFIVTIELSPQDVSSAADRFLSWPTVHGPHGHTA